MFYNTVPDVTIFLFFRNNSVAFNNLNVVGVIATGSGVEVNESTTIDIDETCASVCISNIYRTTFPTGIMEETAINVDNTAA